MQRTKVGASIRLITAYLSILFFIIIMQSFYSARSSELLAGDLHKTCVKN